MSTGRSVRARLSAGRCAQPYLRRQPLPRPLRPLNCERPSTAVSTVAVEDTPLQTIAALWIACIHVDRMDPPQDHPVIPFRCVSEDFLFGLYFILRQRLLV
ncbi:hypothetical protein CDAR_250101 [Caerostris darwini]|uniref:Uncharacterized protein n=1 Tax=Caerostris darwini TaxID=1538125 RepID=A0AAV4R745_9ARAC|nr:hypothetical protein CDAR_250101 [Caerostris darwini]